MKIRGSFLQHLIFMTVGVFIFTGWGLWHLDAISEEAVVRESICRALLANTTEGRQALIGSLWWAPLPTLAILPLALFIDGGGFPVAALLASAFFGTGALLLLERSLARWHRGPARTLLVAALALSPPFLKACSTGSSAPMVLFLAMSTVYGLSGWIARRSLRFLMGLGIAMALLSLSSAALLPWVDLVVLVLLVDVFIHFKDRSHREAALIMALLPVLYSWGVWVLISWVVMGDGLYFVRALWAGHARDAVTPSDLAVHGLALAPALLALVAGITAGVRRHRAGVYMAILAVAPVAIGLMLFRRQWLWNAEPLLLLLLPLALVAVGYITRREHGVGGLARALWLLAPLVLSLVTLAARPVEQTTARGTMRELQRERDSVLPVIKSRVQRGSQYVKVFACGYDGLALLGREADSLFVPAMDLNFNQIRKDYVGHRLYVLIHAPSGRSGMDSTHWKHNRVFELGARSTLYDATWGDWRLFEVIQAPRL